MMKAVSSFLHRTPWWALLGGGFVLLLALGIFTTPFHTIQLDKSGATAAENRAIKSEINSAFYDSAIELARGVVKEMIEHTKDPERKQELRDALTELDSARESMREAGADVLRAKRHAADDVTGALKDARTRIKEAKKEAARALTEARVEREKAGKSLAESLDAPTPPESEAHAAPDAPREVAPDEKKRVIVMGPIPGKPLLDIDVGSGEASVTPLPPELKQEIRKRVTG